MKLGRVAELNENWRNSIKKEKKKIKEGVTLELEGDSVLIESFVLKEEVIIYVTTSYYWRNLIKKIKTIAKTKKKC